MLFPWWVGSVRVGRYTFVLLVGQLTEGELVGRITASGKRGGGAYSGRNVSVVPLVVAAESPAEGIRRVNELLDAIEELVAGFEWADVIRNPRSSMEACADAVVLYRACVEQEASDIGRRQ